MFAPFVSADVPGVRPDESWLHLFPGQAEVAIPRLSGDGASALKGRVRALGPGRAARVSR